MLRVLSLISLFPQFAEQHRIAMLDGITPEELSEKREKTPGCVLIENMLFPLSSLFSQFAAIQKLAPYAADIPVAISNSQPTRCGHTLTRCPLPGLASGFAPSTPIKSQRPKP